MLPKENLTGWGEDIQDIGLLIVQDSMSMRPSYEGRTADIIVYLLKNSPYSAPPQNHIEEHHIAVLLR